MQNKAHKIILFYPYMILSIFYFKCRYDTLSILFYSVFPVKFSYAGIPVGIVHSVTQITVYHELFRRVDEIVT